jgi:hypothetical protein
METTNSWEFFPMQLPERLKGNAILLYESMGVHDIAWDSESIFEVMDFLYTSSTMILGGDVLAKRNNDYDFNGDNWSEDGFDVERGYIAARKFVEDYVAKFGKDFIFTLVCRSSPVSS